jgi:hypothetical protein
MSNIYNTTTYETSGSYGSEYEDERTHHHPDDGGSMHL